MRRGINLFYLAINNKCTCSWPTMNCRSVSKEWHRSWPPGASSRAPSVVLVVAVEIILWSPGEPSLGPLLE